MTRPRLLKLTLAVVALTVTLVGAAAWLTFQHVPGWYQPRWLSRAEMHDVQQELDASFDTITRRLAAGEPFSISLTAGELNDILAAQPRLWPAARQWLGPAFTAPCVHFEERSVRVGMRHRWGSVQSVLHARLSARVAGERLSLAMDDVRAGALRLPAGLWARRLGGVDERGGQVLERMLAGPGGTAVANRFYWPNGDIPFSVDAIELAGDRLTITLQPRI